MSAGSAAAPADLDGWQASTQTVHDAVDAVPLRGLIATLDWPDAAPEPGTPLPPLAARASAPRIEIAGAVLEGVEIGIEPGDAP